MPAAFKGTVAIGVGTSSSTTLVCTTSGAIAVDDLVVVRVATDNLSATTPTLTCTDSGGNTYTRHYGGAVNATAAAGVAGAVFATKATVAVNTGGTITITLSGAVAHKGCFVQSFTGVDNTLRSTVVSATGASTAPATAASGTVNAGDLVIGSVMFESRGAVTGDGDSLNGTWSGVSSQPSATSGSDASCVQAAGQFKIPNAAGAQTYNATISNTDWLASLLVFQAVPEPSITQAAYRIYDDAGTESGAAALAAQDTAFAATQLASDGFGVLRVRLQSTTAIAIPATDDFQLQYEKNASGSWINEGTGAVLAYNNTNLTDGAATTNRLTGGTGTFVAGKISETGDVPNIGWGANNYTELAYSLQLVAAQLVNGDVLRFRVLRNGATTGMTYAVTPTINITVAPSTWTGSSGSIGLAGTSGSFSEILWPYPIPAGGVVGWYDADDPTAFTYSAGAVVSQWADKSGSGKHMTQATVAAQPIRNGTRNGHATVVFDGIDDALLSVGPLTTAIDNITMFVAAIRTGGSNPAVSLEFYNGFSGSDGYGPVLRANNANLGILRGGSGWDASSTPDPAAPGYMTMQRSAGVWSLRYNGNATSLASSTAPTTPAASAQIGHTLFQGEVFEAIMYDRVLTGPEITQVENYLSAKWIYSPIPLDGLTGWYDADDPATVTASGGQVSQWLSKGGVGPVLAQGTGTLQPTTGARTINGRNALDFTDDVLTFSPYTVPQPVTIFAVAKADVTDSQNRQIIGHMLNNPTIYTTGNTWNIYNGSNLESFVPIDTNTHVVVGIWNGVSSGMRLDGASIVTGNLGSNGFSATTLMVGGGNGGYFWDGLIGEVVIYGRVLTAPEIAQVESYLSTKWLPVTGPGGKPKVWNGSAWVEKPLKVWNGSAWVEKPLKVWTGSAWVLA